MNTVPAVIPNTWTVTYTTAEQRYSPCGCVRDSSWRMCMVDWQKHGVSCAVCLRCGAVFDRDPAIQWFWDLGQPLLYVPKTASTIANAVAKAKP
jgi:hypothetical protein